MIAVIDSFTINVEKHGSFSPPSPKKIDAAAKDHLKSQTILMVLIFKMLPFHTNTNHIVQPTYLFGERTNTLKIDGP